MCPSQTWDVYVDQSKAALDKGGGATLDAFVGLAPARTVRVLPSVLTTKGPKTKAPAVRCVATGGVGVGGGGGNIVKSFDVGNVDSVDKVFRILSKHMQVKVGTIAFTMRWSTCRARCCDANVMCVFVHSYLTRCCRASA